MTPPVERKVLVELTDREIALITTALLNTDFTTPANESASAGLFVEFQRLTRSLGIDHQRAALYADVK